MGLIGLKFEYSGYGLEHRILLLHVKNEEFCLECMKGDEIYEIDVTKNVNVFCQGLQEMNIDEWNCRHFESLASLFPGFSWNLSITTSEIHVACDGRDIFPPNWSEFCDLLHRLGLPELKDSLTGKPNMWDVGCCWRQ